MSEIGFFSKEQVLLKNVSRELKQNQDLVYVMVKFGMYTCLRSRGYVLFGVQVWIIPGQFCSLQLPVSTKSPAGQS